MKAARKTWILAGIAAALLGLNLLDSGSAERLKAELPGFAAIDRASATRLELSSATGKIVMTRALPDGEWKITSPFRAEADQVAVRSLLMNFRKDVPIDARVDEGNHDTYGLDAGTAIVAEVWTTSDDPELSFLIGNDAPGGSSFVRMSGSETVYRARIGGRHRYAQPPIGWRNRVLLGFDKDELQALTIARPGEPAVQLERGPSPGFDAEQQPIPGLWQLSPDPGWTVDQLAVEAIASSLGSLRAGEILGADFDGGFDPGRGVITATLGNGDARTLEVGTRIFEGGAFVRVVGEDDVYRVARGPVANALQPPVEFRDKTLFAINRADVDTYTYREGPTEIVLQQDLSNSFWRVIQPQNVDLDMKLVFYSINTIVELRAHDVVAVSATNAGLDSPVAAFSMRLLDGTEQRLEIGSATRDDQDRPSFYVRATGSEEIFLLRDTTIAKLKQGFGRS